ncbi:hypothetical protein C2E20_2186 [Micractinium conductrix]|uniref:Uncharacterized protein n=1 Tax=Micractinium conductrix TaxID=554055 RepID=A0A2P6VKH2_9CHLO|nr:hypothetical protein C2E20_2186 [Micractinium conductrix]|eukprot:PSC74574.1 hypothetical protein C2E20_2186 [Micractinium conductrix]
MAAHAAGGGLAAALRDLGSPAGRLAAFKAVTEHVYGACPPGGAVGSAWRPRTYADNKSRYLWTDAFGVCNYLTLACETGERRWLEQADALIQDVHNTLGKTRDGKRRLGAATDAEPTRGGLRIGKADPEETRDGDGQYFHYVTKWAFALNRMSLARGDHKYNRWAVQLIEATYPHFVHGSGSHAPRMWWKISIDMSRPVVMSEGNLDPFDGLVTYRLLQETAGDPSVLSAEIEDMERMVENKYRRYDSNDPLDLGEALWLSHWALPDEPWAQLVSQRSAAALEELWKDGYFYAPSRYRLAFREFGTTLGVQVNPAAGQRWRPRVDQLHSFWSQNLFSRDADITPVMYCASLLPGAWHRDYAGRLQALAGQTSSEEGVIAHESGQWRAAASHVAELWGRPTSALSSRNGIHVASGLWSRIRSAKSAAKAEASRALRVLWGGVVGSDQAMSIIVAYCAVGLPHLAFLEHAAQQPLLTRQQADALGLQLLQHEESWCCVLADAASLSPHERDGREWFALALAGPLLSTICTALVQLPQMHPAFCGKLRAAAAFVARYLLSASTLSGPVTRVDSTLGSAGMPAAATLLPAPDTPRRQHLAATPLFMGKESPCADSHRRYLASCATCAVAPVVMYLECQRALAARSSSECDFRKGDLCTFGLRLMLHAFECLAVAAQHRTCCAADVQLVYRIIAAVSIQQADQAVRQGTRAGGGGGGGSPGVQFDDVVSALYDRYLEILTDGIRRVFPSCVLRTQAEWQGALAEALCSADAALEDGLIAEAESLVAEQAVPLLQEPLLVSLEQRAPTWEGVGGVALVDAAVAAVGSEQLLRCYLRAGELTQLAGLVEDGAASRSTSQLLGDACCWVTRRCWVTRAVELQSLTRSACCRGCLRRCTR